MLRWGGREGKRLVYSHPLWRTKGEAAPSFSSLSIFARRAWELLGSEASGMTRIGWLGLVVHGPGQPHDHDSLHWSHCCFWALSARLSLQPHCRRPWLASETCLWITVHITLKSEFTGVLATVTAAASPLAKLGKLRWTISVSTAEPDSEAELDSIFFQLEICSTVPATVTATLWCKLSSYWHHHLMPVQPCDMHYSLAVTTGSLSSRLLLDCLNTQWPVGTRNQWTRQNSKLTTVTSILWSWWSTGCSMAHWHRGVPVFWQGGSGKDTTGCGDALCSSATDTMADCFETDCCNFCLCHLNESGYLKSHVAWIRPTSSSSANVYAEPLHNLQEKKLLQCKLWKNAKLKIAKPSNGTCKIIWKMQNTFEFAKPIFAKPCKNPIYKTCEYDLRNSAKPTWFASAKHWETVICKTCGGLLNSYLLKSAKISFVKLCKTLFTKHSATIFYELW